MAESRDRRPDWGPRARMVEDGLLVGTEEVLGEAGKTMLKNAPRLGRVVLEKIPGAPGAVVDAVEFAGAKDKGRKIAGMVGSAMGGAGGAAMGAATGPGAPIAVPLGAAVGSVAGEHIAEEIYDDHIDGVRRGIAQTKAWIRAREEDLTRRALNEMQRYTRPPQLRTRY